MPTLRSAAVTIVFVAAAAAGVDASAQTLYRYTDENGKIHYSDKPLTHLTGRPVDQMNKQGTIVKRTPAAPSAEERAAAEAEQRRRAEVDKLRAAENRRNLALLATYTSEKEIEDAHVFALRDPLEILRETEAKQQAVEKKRAELKAQAEKLGAKPVPDKLRQELAEIELEAKSITEILDAKRRDVQLINDRYEEDRRRFIELQKQRAAMLNANGVSTVSPAAGATKRN